MIVIALFAAGLVSFVLGLFGSTGLIWVGVAWLFAAVRGLQHGRRLKAAIDRTPITVSMVLQGAFVFLAAGLVGLIVGLTQWGIDDPQLRWLPIIGGGLLTAFAVLTAGMFLIGSGIEAAAGEPPTIPATLTLISAKETGTFINERPRIEFVFDVTPEGQPTYRVTKKATVPYTALGSIRPGDGFHAKVAGPDEPEKMDIDWAATIPGR